MARWYIVVRKQPNSRNSISWWKNRAPLKWKPQRTFVVDDRQINSFKQSQCEVERTAKGNHKHNFIKVSSNSFGSWACHLHCWHYYPFTFVFYVYFFTSYMYLQTNICFAICHKRSVDKTYTIFGLMKLYFAKRFNCGFIQKNFLRKHSSWGNCIFELKKF